MELEAVNWGQRGVLMTGNGYIKVPNEWIDEITTPEKLWGIVHLLRTRNYTTGEITESVRSLMKTTGLTMWQCREAIAFVERGNGNAAQIPHSVPHKIRTAKPAPDTAPSDSAAQIPHSPPQDFRTHIKKQEGPRSNTTTTTTTNPQKPPFAALRRRSLSEVQQERFNRWYSAYPLKVARAAAESAWLKLNPDETLTVSMIASITMQQADREARTARNLFTPEWKHPATWLNKGCWNDEIGELPKTKRDVINDTISKALDRLDGEPAR